MNQIRKCLKAAALCTLTVATGCTQVEADQISGTFNPSASITLLSREDGSGTRSAFSELFGLLEKQSDGTETDLTSPDSIVTSSTSVMLTTVSSDPSAIGYVSMGSLNDTVRAVAIDGTAASADSIRDGSYQVSRPFLLVMQDSLSPAAQDFLNYILSASGQKTAEENGCVAVSEGDAYEPASVTGTVVVSGSSSVTPLMQKLAEAYGTLQPDVEVEIQQSDSSTGIADAADGVSDLGMASRELKESEQDKGLTAVTIAMDGIAVIVSPDNEIESLSSEQVRDIFSGKTTVWADVLN